MSHFNICFRSPTDPYYREVLSTLTSGFIQQSVLPFLGAGSSVDAPSHLPIADKLCAPMIEVLWKSVQPVIEEANLLQNNIEFARSILSNARLERLLDALQQVYGQIALRYLHPLNSTRWNENHASLVAFCREGLLRQCVTLNFDLLIEYAAEAHGVNYQTICPLVHNQRYQQGIFKRSIAVIKPHGSFVMSSNSDDQLDTLRTTLSQLGTEPHPLNEEVLSRAFDDHEILLVAGYSDDDWDIFPIIAQQAKRLRRIIWVQYADSYHISEQIEPSKDKNNWPLYNRIKPMLQRCNIQSTLVYAVLKDIFRDIRDKLGISIENLPTNGPVIRPDISIFSDSIKNALATSSLLQHTGDVSRNVLNWLAKREVIKSQPNLQFHVENLLSHTEHTRRKVYNAIPHMKRAIRIMQHEGSTNKYYLAKLHIWLGYEYLCLAKRPLLARPWLLLLAPYFIWKGKRLLRLWSAEENNDIPQNSVIADDFGITLYDYASYYRTDLLHAWANLLMVFGPKSNLLAAPLYKLILHRYEIIASRSRLMTKGYYLLRMIEARLLSGNLPDRFILEQQLNALEDQYRLTQENVQAGNINAYRALLSFVYDHDKKTASNLLNDAIIAWKNTGKDQASGFDRVRLFSRFFGI